jgi:hypothetical protein
MLAVAAVSAGAVTNTRVVLYLIAALVLAGAFVMGILNWRWSVVGLVLYLPVSGIPILALYPHTQGPVLAKDFLFVIPCYIGFLSEAIFRRRRVSYDGAPTVMLASFALLILVQTVNPRTASLLVALIGVKVYLLYVPLLYVSYQLVQTRADLWRLLALLAIPATIPCAIGIAEAALIYTGHSQTVYSLYGAAASAATQGFFSPILGVVGGATLSRVPSTFSYTAQFYFYTIAMIAIAYAYLRGPLRDRGRTSLGWGLLILVFTASLLSGSRGAFLFAPAMLLLILVLDRVGGVSLFLIVVAIVLGFLVALSLIGTQLSSVISSATTDGAANGQIIFSWIPRALHLTLIGIGTGMDTGASRYAYTPTAISPAFQAFGGVWLETWWVKIMVELGIPGLLLVIALFGKLIGGGVVDHLKVRDPQLRSVSAALLAVLIWNVVYAVKAQNIDLDPMDVYFWLFAGVLARVHVLDREAVPSPAQQATKKRVPSLAFPRGRPLPSPVATGRR